MKPKRCKTTVNKYIKGLHITIEVTGTTSHSVVGLDLLPYDSTNNYGFDSCGRVNVDGTIEDIYATIDDNGIVNITPPTGGTITKVYYTIR